MNLIKVDFSKTTGVVKPLHGINNSPLTYGDELPELKNAGIPFVRLHDSGGAFGGTYLVDVPNIFPDFEADPNDPASYDFAFTDAYLKGLTASGMKIFYRLGVTIENNFRIKPHRIHPPKDFAKWAEICAGIVRHYNQGWAAGFHYDIEYWEIWNEPENPPMWTGTREQYYELYRVTANYLKQQFPDIKVGGYAGCGFYTLNHEGMSDLHQTFVPYFLDFLKFITTPATSAPLDFFSWHLYTSDPHEIILHANFVDEKLKESGLDGVENIFNEWNFIDRYDPDRWDSMKEMPGATFVASAFCLMQRSAIDKAMYYDALPTRRYCGLYYFPSQKVTKTYYSFKAFNELYKLGTAVECSSDEQDGLYVCAAKDDATNGAVLIVNKNATGCSVTVEIIGKESNPTCQVLDKSRLLEDGDCFANGALLLPPQSVILLRYMGENGVSQKCCDREKQEQVTPTNSRSDDGIDGETFS